MKPGRSDIHGKARSLPELRFENQTLTSLAGRVLDFLHRRGHVHDEMITALNGWRGAFTVSVPFER